MIEEPEDVLVRYTLAFAYDAMGQHDLAIRILRLSGLPDIVLEETMRNFEFARAVGHVRGELPVR